MSKLPQVSGRECVVALQRLGFAIVRQRGSHIILRRADRSHSLSCLITGNWIVALCVPVLRQAEISVEEFVSVL